MVIIFYSGDRAKWPHLNIDFKTSLVPLQNMQKVSSDLTLEPATREIIICALGHFQCHRGNALKVLHRPVCPWFLVPLFKPMPTVRSPYCYTEGSPERKSAIWLFLLSLPASPKAKLSLLPSYNSQVGKAVPLWASIPFGFCQHQIWIPQKKLNKHKDSGCNPRTDISFLTKSTCPKPNYLLWHGHL